MGGGAAAAAAAAGSFVDLQLLSNSVSSESGGAGGESPAAARSHRKGGSGGSGGSGSFNVEGEGEEWGIGRVPSDVSRWAGLGVVENLEVRAGCCWWGGGSGGAHREGEWGEGVLFAGGHSVLALLVVHYLCVRCVGRQVRET